MIKIKKNIFQLKKYQILFFLIISSIQSYAEVAANWDFEGNNPTSDWSVVLKNNWNGYMDIVDNGCNGKSFQFNITNIGDKFNITTCYVTSNNITLKKDSVYRLTFKGKASVQNAKIAIVLFNSTSQQIATQFMISTNCEQSDALITHTYDTSLYQFRVCFYDNAAIWYQLDDIKLVTLGEVQEEEEPAEYKPSNPNVTAQTNQLYNYLLNNVGKGILFGHHMTINQGQNFRAIPINENNIQSDVYTAVNDYPAIAGLDFSRGYEDKLLTTVKKYHSMGGIITISHHMSNPVTDGNYNDTSGNPVNAILYNPSIQNKFKTELDKVASFCNNANIGGVKIPIIYRPFLEHNGDWFWWGMSHCTEQEYIDLWRFTYNYLVNTKNVNNILFAFSPSKPSRYGSYEIRYPGNDYVDICGIDYYDQGDFACDLLVNAELCSRFAQKNSKIAAITEFGVKEGIQNTNIPDWFMSAFLNPLKGNEYGLKMAYALTWMNTKENSYWVPLPGNLTYDSFVDFYNDPYTLFLSNIEDYLSTDIISNKYSASNTTVFPNPVNNILQINSDNDRIFTLKIINSIGQLISTHTINSSNKNVYMNSMQSGIYIIELTDLYSTNKQYFKIIKK